MHLYDTRTDKVFGYVNAVIMVVVAFITAYPLIWILSSSLSDPHAQLAGQVRLLPVGFELTAYRIVLAHPDIMRSYLNTIIYTTVGVAISVTLSAFYAYPLSRKHFFGRGLFTTVLMITMFFSGGMIPSFLLVSRLGMLDTIWAIVLPSALSVYNIIVMRTFYMTSIPDELEESAFLDGANDLHFFWYVVIPLSKAIAAVMVLFYGVAAWNSWFNAFLYTSSRNMFPLQLILREIILQGTAATGPDSDIIRDGVRFATMVVATVPIMCIYPFIQKYFTKGVMVGSLKG